LFHNISRYLFNNFILLYHATHFLFLYSPSNPDIRYAGLERLVEPLKSTCTMKVKANSVKQEYEKQDELKRSALRAVVALLTIPDAGKRNYSEVGLKLN